MKKLFLGLMTFVVVFVGVFVLGEVLIRVITSSKNVYNIEMVKYAKKLKTADPNGIVSHVHKKNAAATLMGVDVRLNNLGNRGNDLPVVKDQNVKRILVLGSSITMGWGVPFESVFTTIVERELNNKRGNQENIQYEVANAGIGNYNSYYQYQLFMEQYPIVKPDAVVLHYFVNDAEPDPKRNDNYLLQHSLLAAYFYDKIGVFKYMVGKGNSLIDFYDKVYADDSPSWHKALDSVEKMRDICKKDGVPFLVMIVPDIHNLSKNSPFQKYYSKIEAACKDRGIQSMNCFDAFQKAFGEKEKDLWIQSDDPHPNEKGHAIMAEVLLPYVEGLFGESATHHSEIQPHEQINFEERDPDAK